MSDTGTTDATDVETEGAIGGIVLAAGTSSRFETGNKLLKEVDGQPIIRHVAETASGSALDEVVVVVGHEADAVRDAVADMPVTTRHNEDYADGQSTSVREGVLAARAGGWDGAVFLLGDMPFVRPATVDRVIETFRDGDGSIIAPRFEGMRGNPVLFGRQHFDVLAELSGDRGGRELIEEHAGTRFVDVDDPGILKDVDTKAELQEYSE